MAGEKVTNISSLEEAKRVKSVLEIINAGTTYEIVEQAGGTFVVQPVGQKASSATRKLPSHPANTEGNLAPLFNVIGKAESGNNYNAYYSKARNEEDPRLTDMTVDQVILWQKGFVQAGSPSSAAGRFQIIRKTLKGLKTKLRLSGSELYDAAMQDRMARELLRQRGIDDYLSGLTDLVEFGNSIAKEWASLPVMSGPKKGQSFYSGDGLNHALVTVDEITKALRPLTA